MGVRKVTATAWASIFQRLSYCLPLTKVKHELSVGSFAWAANHELCKEIGAGEYSLAHGIYGLGAGHEKKVALAVRTFLHVRH